MEKLFISYELSLLAKENGFNDQCMGIYAHKHNNKDNIAIWRDYEWETNQNSQSWVQLVNAPLYQQLIDWFRNTHQIEITIMPVFREKCGYDSFKRDGYTYELMIIEPCQWLCWADFNRCAENIDQEIKENDNEGLILKPSLPNYYDVVNLAIKEAFKLLEHKTKNNEKKD